MTDNYRLLRLPAEMFWDTQAFRMAMENKRRSETIIDEIVYINQFVDEYKRIEKDLGALLLNQYRKAACPEIRAWQKSQNGIGEHLLALLLGLIGDPYHTTPHHWVGKGKGKKKLVEGEPYDRTVNQLWAYCGHGAILHKTKDMSQEEAFRLGNPRAKMVTHLLAEACVKAGVRYFCDDGVQYKPWPAKEVDAGLHEKDVCQLCEHPKDEHGKKSISDYGQVYLDARHHYEDRVHLEPHVRCGPKGKPAPAGSPWSQGHQNGAALRKVGKELLKDLWIAAREGAA